MPLQSKKRKSQKRKDYKQNQAFPVIQRRNCAAEIATENQRDEYQTDDEKQPVLLIWCSDHNLINSQAAGLSVVTFPFEILKKRSYVIGQILDIIGDGQFKYIVTDLDFVYDESFGSEQNLKCKIVFTDIFSSNKCDPSEATKRQNIKKNFNVIDVEVPQGNKFWIDSNHLNDEGIQLLINKVKKHINHLDKSENNFPPLEIAPHQRKRIKKKPPFTNKVLNYVKPLKIFWIEDYHFYNLNDSSRKKVTSFLKDAVSNSLTLGVQLDDLVLFVDENHKIKGSDFINVKISNDVFQAFINVIVKKANSVNGVDTEKFRVLYSEEIEDMKNSLLYSENWDINDLSYSSQTYNSRSGQKIENLLFFWFLDPDLKMLGWYNRKKHGMKLFCFENQNTSESQKTNIAKIICRYLKTVNQEQKEPVLEWESNIKLNNSITDLLHACKFADYIIHRDKISNSDIVDAVSNISNGDDYRLWIFYILYANSSLVDHRLNHIATHKLHNLGNTCWFNVIVQAVVALIKQGDRSKNFGRETIATFENNCLNEFVMDLVSNEEIGKSRLEKTVEFACSLCNFVNGEPQDVAEFYRLSNLTELLLDNDLSCSFQSKTLYKCGICGTESQSITKDNIELKLPLCGSIKNGSKMQLVLAKYLDREEDRKCDSCWDFREQKRHSVREMFQYLPDILMINLFRYALFGQNTKRISPFSNIRIEDENKNEHIYKLTFAIVFFRNQWDEGHVVGYKIIDENFAKIVDDDNVKLDLIEQVKPVIESNGYLFFYTKTTPV